jgi:hypothetical protein
MHRKAVLEHDGRRERVSGSCRAIVLGRSRTLPALDLQKGSVQNRMYLSSGLPIQSPAIGVRLVAESSPSLRALGCRFGFSARWVETYL